MDFLQKPPEWLVEAVPQGEVRDFLQGDGWYAVLGAAGLIVLMLFWLVLSRLFRGKEKEEVGAPNLEEDLGNYPEPGPSTNQQLRVEAVPVRIRLVVVAPAGKDADVDTEHVKGILERLVPGLGEICQEDRSTIKIWPRQFSYEGFAQYFHKNMLTPESAGELSRWILLAGRVKLGSRQVLLGLALQSAKPTTSGRKAVDAHEWASMLHVGVKQ